MGREAAISAEQVYAVADSMKAEGGKPTLRAVRERLGNIGSMGTISKLLQQWKAGHERQVATALTLPPTLQRTLLEFIDQELTAARATLETELADQLQVASDLATESERQQEAIELQTLQLSALSAEKAVVEGRTEQLVVDLASAREEANRERQAAELARTELAKAILRLEAMLRLESDLEATRAELIKQREVRVSAEQQAAVLSAQKNSVESQLTDIKQEVIRLTERLDKAQDQLEQERGLRARAEQQAAVLAVQNDALVKV